MIEQTKDYKLKRLDHTISKYLAKRVEPTKIASQKPSVQIDRDISNGR